MKKLSALRPLITRWTLSIFGLLLVCAAAAHRLQLNLSDPHAYSSSPLIAAEFVLLILVLALLLIGAPVQAIRLSVKKQWHDLGVLALNVLIGGACVVAAIALDAPTLIYAT